MTKLNPVIDNVLYGYDKISYRKKIKKLERIWYLYDDISSICFRHSVGYLYKAIGAYFKSIMYGLRFILSPKK